MNRSPFYTEAQLKSFDFSPWGGIDGFLKAAKSGLLSDNRAKWLKRVVPDLSHAVDMTATAVSSLPFNIVDEGGKIVDSSQDWKGEYIQVKDFKRVLYLVASSLCGGAAYLIPRRTPKLIFDLQYMVPHSIAPYIDREGLKWFDRATDQGKTERLYPSNKQIIWFWLPDSDIEIGPAENTPLGNASNDAELILNATNTMKMYGERGWVPITLLGAKGMPDGAERTKAEGYFDRLLRGGFDVLAKIFNADALSIEQIGAGMEALKGTYVELVRKSQEAIAASFGIPSALYMSDNAFASEFDALTRQWYMASRFKQIYQTIEGSFNTQLLEPYKLKLMFDLQSLDIFQADESKRSQSLTNLVTAITKDPKVARFGMGVLGYDLTKEQEAQYDEAEKQIEEQKEKMQEQTEMGLQAKLNGGGKQDKIQKQDTDKQDEEDKAIHLSPDEIKDMALWYSKAKAWHLKGKGNAVDWENKHLREEIAAPIRKRLAVAKNELDITRAFEIGARSDMLFAPEVRAVQELADAINRAVDEDK